MSGASKVITIVGEIATLRLTAKLEPVGLDVDGEWRSIDRLSDIPKEGEAT